LLSTTPPKRKPWIGLSGIRKITLAAASILSLVMVIMNVLTVRSYADFDLSHLASKQGFVIRATFYSVIITCVLLAEFLFVLNMEVRRHKD
jgi:hypothetical protein